MNVVPTAATKKLARLTVRHAAETNGADAALRWLREIDPDQIGAYVGILASFAAGGNTGLPGRPRVAETYTEETRRIAHACYARGERGPWVIEGEREYQRLHKRKVRAA